MADLTGDGIVDLAVASFGCATCSVGDLSILRGNGNGTFQPALKHAVLPGQRPIGIAAGDFNGDGFADLAVTDLLSLRVTLWRGIGDGTFDSPQRFDVRNGATWLTVDDLDGNDTPDLVVANMASANVSVLLNTHTNPPPTMTLLSTPGGFSISWPDTATNFDLLSATGFDPLDWQSALEPRSTNVGEIKVNVLFNEARRFFRLKKP